MNPTAKDTPMRTASFWLVFLLIGVAAPRAQEVVLDSGDVLTGKVQQVKGNRVQVRTTDGALRAMSVRSIVGERAADGTLRRFHAELTGAPIGPAETALLQRVRQGKAIEVPEMVRATESCGRELAAALQAVLADGSPAARIQAARVLAVTCVPEAVKAALTAALADATGRMLAEVAQLWTETSLGALEAAEALPLLDQALATKDPGARFGMAWLAAQLGSEAALPVLRAFLGDRDHHVRESAATMLAERGDAAGAAIVLTIASRERAPVQTANCNADPETKALVDRLALRERCRACELLGKLRHEPALPVLRRLAKAKNAELAAAAQRAEAAIRGG